MTGPVVDCGAGENARRAKWWRDYSNAPGVTEAERAYRWEVSEQYQALATCGNLEPEGGKNADEAVDW